MAAVGCADASRSPSEGGDRAYRKRSCYRCHGADRSGTEIGPPLTDLRRNWDVAALTAYLADPATFRERDPRLRDLVARYRGRLMKGTKAPEEERRALAAWLLAQGK